MEAKYKFYIVINDTAHAIEMVSQPASEKEAQDFMESMQQTEGIWVGLESGDMVAVNKKLMSNVYFKAVRI